MSALAYIAHGIPGRTRLRVPAQRGDSAYFAQTVGRLSACPGVVEIQANPLTASLLIRHVEPFSAVAEFARAHHLFTLESSPQSPVTLTRQASETLAWLDGQFNQFSAGQWDVRSLVFLGLLALSVVQIARGEIVAPAVTLLWYALQLIGIDRPLSPSAEGKRPKGRRTK